MALQTLEVNVALTHRPCRASSRSVVADRLPEDERSLVIGRSQEENLVGVTLNTRFLGDRAFDEPS
jgi:hypothetical protein